MAETILLYDGGKGNRIRIRIEGHTPDEIAAAVIRLGSMPASVVNYPAKKVAQTTARLAVVTAPYRTGALAGGIVVSSKEKTRVKGKAVYDVWMDPAKSDIFTKYAGGKRYYYPASMEYGFRLQKGGRWPGLYYMKRAGEAAHDAHTQYTIDYVWRRLEKLWMKKTGGAT